MNSGAIVKWKSIVRNQTCDCAAFGRIRLPAGLILNKSYSIRKLRNLQDINLGVHLYSLIKDSNEPVICVSKQRFCAGVVFRQAYQLPMSQAPLSHALNAVGENEPLVL